MARAMEKSGWTVADVLGRHDAQDRAADGVDLLLIATPDRDVVDTALAVAPVEDTVVAHLSGVLGLEVLAPHARRASLHPLVSLPGDDAGTGAVFTGSWFAVAGDPLARRLVEDLGGRPVVVSAENRAAYHAAAVVASNHLVALLGQTERIAASVGVPLEAFLELAAASVDNVRRLGAAGALTGPAARGDEDTIRAHLEALEPAERDSYSAVAELARRLAGRSSR
ncbi:MAG: stilbene synthase [Acidimicrobiaceae bacterium]|nr:stilbene synthase [Acidimicrobiaceae bacterium]